jgi:hypothetical protein
MNGYEAALAAGMRRKEVSLALVTDKDLTLKRGADTGDAACPHCFASDL